MPLYLYTAKNQQGESQIGSQEANDKHELANLLRSRGLVLISAETSEQKKAGRFGLKNLIQRFSHVPLTEKMIFTQQLSVMIKAGLHLNQALLVLANQTKNYRFKKIINKIEEDLRRGQPLSSSFAKYPKVFNELFVNMIKVGESGGNLDEVLDILADQMKKDHELISRVRGALIYPAVIISAMIGIGIFMMIVVVPKITEVFEDLSMELPLSTRLIIGTSQFLRNNLILGIIIFIGGIFLIRLIFKIKFFKSLLHRIYLKLPIFGVLIKKINSSRLARTFSSLIQSGVTIINALEITAGTLGNIHFKNSLLKSTQEVQRGKELNQALEKYKSLYPPMVIQVIKVGEETGSLTETLDTLANFYESEIDNTTKNLTSIIEPIVMIIIGGAVGFFAISMIQPMYSIVGGL